MSIHPHATVAVVVACWLSKNDEIDCETTLCNLRQLVVHESFPRVRNRWRVVCWNGFYVLDVGMRRIRA